MKLVHHLKKHSKTVACHLKHHHKKYLAGFFGGFAVVKLFALIIWLSAVQYTVFTHAQQMNGCSTTGQVFTGEYLTWQELSSWYLVDCVVTPWYWTGGQKDEFGELTWQIRVEEVVEWCVLTGQELTWGYLTWGYRTWGIELCNQGLGTGNGELGTGNEVVIANYQWNWICELDDIVWESPLSWSVVRDIFSLDWSYSGGDCSMSWLIIQLWDHNNQRISLTALASGVDHVTFDSKVLVASWLYHVLGTGLSGQTYYLYTWTYSGNYSRWFSGYQLRLITPDQTLLRATWPFTIDNQVPSLTWVSLFSDASTSGFVRTGVVRLAFTASELLSGLQVTLWSWLLPTSSSVSGLLYTYTRNLTSLTPQWPLVVSTLFSDVAGNTWALVYTSSLIFDTVAPMVTWFVFADYASWLSLSFTSSEFIRTSFTYQTTGGVLMTWSTSTYLPIQYLSFTGIQRDLLYLFTWSVSDLAGNVRTFTGDMLRTSTGAIVSHLYLVPIVDTVLLSWNLVTLAVTLKDEVNKFALCKSGLSYTPIELQVRRTTFILQMPTFKKSQTKTLVNAFTLFVLDKMKHNYQMTNENISDITKKFDNFLVVLKLLRDDDNVCKQNLSLYHISQFKRALKEYKISLE